MLSQLFLLHLSCLLSVDAQTATTSLNSSVQSVPTPDLEILIYLETETVFSDSTLDPVNQGSSMTSSTMPTGMDDEGAGNTPLSQAQHTPLPASTPASSIPEEETTDVPVSGSVPTQPEPNALLSPFTPTASGTLPSPDDNTNEAPAGETSVRTQNTVPPVGIVQSYSNQTGSNCSYTSTTYTSVFNTGMNSSFNSTCHCSVHHPTCQTDEFSSNATIFDPFTRSTSSITMNTSTQIS